MAKSENIRVVMVCGGRTAWDEAGRVGGACDLPMTPQGQAELQTSMAELAGARLAAVLTAPDESSRQTAQLVSATIASGTPPKVRKVNDLADVCMGLWEGMRHEEIQEKFPKAFRQWREDPQAIVVPEGETLEEAQNRIVQALSSALGRYGGGDGAVAIVLRPMALTLVRCWLEAAPLRNVWSMLSDAPGLRWRTIERDQLRRRPTPVRINA